MSHEPGQSLEWFYSEMLVELFVEPGRTSPSRKFAWLCTTPFRVELRMIALTGKIVRMCLGNMQNATCGLEVHRNVVGGPSLRDIYFSWDQQNEA